MVTSQAVCSFRGCCALAVPTTGYCTVHLAVSVRSAKGVGVPCYACGHSIRLGRRFMVRAEGPFHLRLTCSGMPPEQWVIQIRQAS